MAYTAEFMGGCWQGKRVVEDGRDEWRAVRRPNPLKFDDRAEIHVYRRGVRRFSREVTREQAEQIIAERGELVYVLERVEPLHPALEHFR